MVNQLAQFTNIVVDYSVISEFVGTNIYIQFFEAIKKLTSEVYVSETFVDFHRCMINQYDVSYVENNGIYATAIKEFSSALLRCNRLHHICVLNTKDFLDEVVKLENCCIILSENSILAQRLKLLEANANVAVCALNIYEFKVYSNISDFVAELKENKVSSLATRKEYLDENVFCNVGDIVITGDRQELRLEKRISLGAEGMVFFTDDPTRVAKIYHRGIITPLRWRKLTKMVEVGIKGKSVCWPLELLFYKGVPVGYTMIKATGKTLSNVFDGPDAINENFPEWQRIDIVDSLIMVLETYTYLHMKGVVAGDIQLRNALINSPNEIYLIDMDSVQISDLPCPVGTIEFTSPELWGKDFSSFLRNLHDEDYSIGMLVFSLLFCGLHPYATRNGKETLNEEILDRAFPYTLDNSNTEHIPKGGYEYIWEYLPRNIREMLYACFKEGKTFECIEWIHVLREYRNALDEHRYSDKEAYKIYPKMEYDIVVKDESNRNVSSFSRKSVFDNVVNSNNFDKSNNCCKMENSTFARGKENKGWSGQENTKRNKKGGVFGIFRK